VVFGEHSNITNLGQAAFQSCFVLTSITLPDKLEVIEKGAFSRCSALRRFVCNNSLKTIGRGAFQHCSVLTSITFPDKLKIIVCTSLERVVCNKNLKTIGELAFLFCRKLADVQLASSSTSFGLDQIVACDRLIELAAATGFPSNTFGFPHSVTGQRDNMGEGVVPYLIHRFERNERKRFVLLALMRFKNAVHAHDGTEEKKVAAAQKHHPRPASMPHPTCFTCKAKRRPTRTLRLCACNRTWFCNKQCQIEETQGRVQKSTQTQKAQLQQGQIPRRRAAERAMRGGGHKGVLGTILSYV